MLLVALGSNLNSPAGGPRETLETALAFLASRGLATAGRSRWFRTAAFPAGSGPDYVNGAAVLAGDASPEAALATLHEVEAALARRRDRRWGPRSCDLDLLAAGDAVRPDAASQRRWMQDPEAAAGRATPDRLVLPHPRLQERAFVLVPLAEVASGWRHPMLGLTVTEMLAALPAAAREAVVALED